MSAVPDSARTVNHDPCIADEVLWGRKAISAELGIPVPKLDYRLKTGTLPVRRLGRLIYAVRSELRAHFLGQPAA